MTRQDAKTCARCGKRFLSPKYRREHERSPFAHLTAEEYLSHTVGRDLRLGNDGYGYLGDGASGRTGDPDAHA